MKTLSILFFAMLFNLAPVYSQFGSTCLPEGITFSTQAQIDSFQINYPGCTGIEGDVVISGADIIELNGLLCMTSIGGRLSIYGNTILTNLAGLDNLTSVGGALSIYGNDLLTNITGLGTLTSVGESINMGIIVWWSSGTLGNPSLTSLTGLEGITSINYLGIVGNS